MRRIFKTKALARWVRRAELTEAALCSAVSEMVQGLFDAELAGGLVKKRVPLPGRGKRGSTRTLLATNRGSRWYFVFGFEKNERDNITPEELSALKLLADDLLKPTDAQIDNACEAGALTEICHDHTKN